MSTQRMSWLLVEVRTILYSPEEKFLVAVMLELLEAEPVHAGVLLLPRYTLKVMVAKAGPVNLSV